jgi:hypothetical protein
MTTSAATVVINLFPAGIDNTQRLTYVRGTISLAAGTYSKGGLALNWITEKIKAQGIYANPIQVTFFSQATATYSSSAIGGFGYLWNKLKNTLQLLATADNASAGTGPISEEMTDGTTIPTAIMDDTIAFEAVFVRSFS